MKKVFIMCAATALILMFSAVSAAGCFWDKDGTTAPNVLITEAPNSDEDTDGLREEPAAAQTFREATLYYISDEGYVVPVKKLIPWEEGIAKACLAYITSAPGNDSAASAMGLRTVLPAGTETELAISDGEARLDLKNLAPCATAEEERKMVTALVDTLCEFSTVNRVTITRDGAGGALEHGTELPRSSPRCALNIEQTELEASAGSVPGTLYFPNLSGALTVPVTRYFGSEPSIYKKVSALIEGPAAADLMCCFPEGTLLLGAAVENGVATVNLSEDFKSSADVTGMYSLAYRTLFLTLAEDNALSGLVIQVNGAVFAPEDPMSE